MTHQPKTRREFISNVGGGMVIAGIGSALAAELGFTSRFAYADEQKLELGDLRALVDQMRELPADQLQEKMVAQLTQGNVTLKRLTAAAALANAETFGGQDYVGFHTEMALVPAWEMSQELPAPSQPLPVLKVLYRNAQRIQAVGGTKKTTLQPIESKTATPATAQQLRDAARNQDMEEAEQLFASVQDIPLAGRFSTLLPMIADDINVHRFVLAHRTLELVDLVGIDQAHTMLRQCVRYCVQEENQRSSNGRSPAPIRKLIPKLFDQYKLDQLQPGSRDPGDEWIDEMANTIYQSNEFFACDAVAAALADRIAPDVIAEAISLAANALVLRQGADRWRTHGDSAGVHASDAANAWRQMIKVTDKRNGLVGLIVSTYHTAMYQPFREDPYPLTEHAARIGTDDEKTLLGICEECIQVNDQGIAAAAISKYGGLGYDPRPVFDLMLKYAISEDGRLHAEKYYRTVVEEFASARPGFRWRQLVALARVTASAYGYDREDRKGHRAAGYDDARRLLRIS
jgi:hypothetical protein